METQNHKSKDVTDSKNRSIRIFVSSTFRDMMEERNILMTHAWPELRRFCLERQVELVEVDLRWGIAEEQSTRKETLKLCLDEIRACRPFFIGLLGERYGWVPEEDAFTADLKEEQPWLEELYGKSVTELEILHGVLNDPAMAPRSFFYFRDPSYAHEHGSDFLPEDDIAAEKQSTLKKLIRTTCAEKNISLHETYPDPEALAKLVFEHLKDAIESQFPKEEVPDPLVREARDHEAFAEIRRRTYIGRPDYYEALDQHIMGEGKPLVLLGESGSGKSALLANWISKHRKEHPKDFIFQHYIGGTSDSSVHWKLIKRLMAEIKQWTDDPDDLPSSNDDMLRDFPLWLSKARIRAEHDGISFIVVLDALNQLEDKDHGRLLGWLPEHPFTGALRLIVSTLPGETQEIIIKRNWPDKHIRSLNPDERRRVIVDYLQRFGKKLDDDRLYRLANTDASSNPLYLKILLDELRITGTHDRLDERLDDYLSANDIPGLLRKVISRYQLDYEQDRKGLVKDALGYIWAARRGLTEAELLELLKPGDLPQLPLATWAPLRAALEDSLVDRGGIFNFAHDFLRIAVETAFLPDLDKKDDFRIDLADYFESLPPSTRTCDELPWLLMEVEMFDRLRNCLLNIDNFLLIKERDKDELHQYWVDLGDETAIGKAYLDSFNRWAGKPHLKNTNISDSASHLGFFLMSELSLLEEAKPLMEFALKIDEKNYGMNHSAVAINLNNLGMLLQATNRFEEAEPLIRRALEIEEKSSGLDHTLVARASNNLALLLLATNRLKEAEPLFLRTLKIFEKSYGKDHPMVAICLNNLSQLLEDTNRLKDAESLLQRALKIDEKSYGLDHPKVAIRLNNLVKLQYAANHLKEAESLAKRALKINEKNFGIDHPEVATTLNNLAMVFQDTNRLNDAESILRRALKIDENTFGMEHTIIATRLKNLASVLMGANRLKEAEPLIRRALVINEKSSGRDHPDVAISLNILGTLLQATDRLKEAEPIYLRAIEILFNFTRKTGHQHPRLKTAINIYGQLLQSMGLSIEQIIAQLKKIAPEFTLKMK